MQETSANIYRFGLPRYGVISPPLRKVIRLQPSFLPLAIPDSELFRSLLNGNSILCFWGQQPIGQKSIEFAAEICRVDFACRFIYTRLRDRGHGTPEPLAPPTTREENFYIAFPTSLDCLSPPLPPPSLTLRCVGGGAWTLFRFRDETWQAAPPPPPPSLPSAAAVSLRPLAIKAE